VLFDFKLYYAVSNYVMPFQIVLFDFKLYYSISNYVILFQIMLFDLKNINWVQG
jgi:hypothetical protein